MHQKTVDITWHMTANFKHLIYTKAYGTCMIAFSTIGVKDPSLPQIE